MNEDSTVHLSRPPRQLAAPARTVVNVLHSRTVTHRFQLRRSGQSHRLRTLTLNPREKPQDRRQHRERVHRSKAQDLLVVPDGDEQRFARRGPDCQKLGRATFRGTEWPVKETTNKHTTSHTAVVLFSLHLVITIHEQHSNKPVPEVPEPEDENEYRQQCPGDELRLETPFRPCGGGGGRRRRRQVH